MMTPGLAMKKNKMTENDLKSLGLVAGPLIRFATPEDLLNNRSVGLYIGLAIWMAARYV